MPGQIDPLQLFDTQGGSRRSFSKPVVAHVSVADPLCTELTPLPRGVRDVGGTAHEGGTYITTRGPRFSPGGKV